MNKNKLNKNKKNKNLFNKPPIEVNILLKGKGRSNSLLHHKENANKRYDERISLEPSGELKFEHRGQIPTSHIKEIVYKTNYLNEMNTIKSFDKANHESDINSQIRKQKHQLLLEKDLHLNAICEAESREIKLQAENRKKLLQEELKTIIQDTLVFAKKNSPAASMLPPGVYEFFENMKENEPDNSALTISNNSRTSRKFPKNIKIEKKPKNEFLAQLGVDVEDLSKDNVNVDLEKAWDFMMSWSKGRNLNEIVRYKVVNSIMSLTEQKASEKAKELYGKIELYKEHKKKERREALRKKREEEKKKREMIKTIDPDELIKLRMRESLSQPKNFVKKDRFSALSTPKFKKKKKKDKDEVVKKETIKLDAYKDVDTILKFINDSKRHSQSKYCKEHFNNILRTKSMDQNMRNLLRKNLIIEKKD